MKFIIVFIFLIFVTVTSYFIGYEEQQAPKNSTQLDTLHKKFLQLDIENKDLDLDTAIQEIKEARKLYPLDDKLKMIEIELEHKRANQ